ncbi:hypothetical protein A3A21_03790 [Candidatus Jorgensenbacteria bacterium RIFCSPLOWO2_01_FULL_45_25b]|uniref:Uncharacterized protein n=1 Tax=Candidatus Jorgensenbacteria bacterium RIFCSPLOWO2_01_FULL_45_25b TaxID=1798471 RepID=A0A1F6BY55_9BACT|nr:MAG: hypothetical protein A3A21_03790 [Candidatus Jorgensenbacteria bacterium RIFCSPLOWO2_01_FULL_45_25b]
MGWYHSPEMPRFFGVCLFFNNSLQEGHVMGNNKRDRQAMRKVSPTAVCILGVLEAYEQGEFVALPELCIALQTEPTFVAFSCLSGDGLVQELDLNLGAFFKKRAIEITRRFFTELRANSCRDFPLVVFLDDCEPCRVWQWNVFQDDMTAWCRMMLEDARDWIPAEWSVRLWSEIESELSFSYEQALFEVRGDSHALLLYRLAEYMRRFPNKKLVGDVNEAIRRRVAQYALQGAVLEKVFPHAILLQTEAPWSVKDLLYDTMRQTPLPIVHLYPERR